MAKPAGKNKQGQPDNVLPIKRALFGVPTLVFLARTHSSRLKRRYFFVICIFVAHGIIPLVLLLVSGSPYPSPRRRMSKCMSMWSFFRLLSLSCLTTLCGYDAYLVCGVRCVCIFSLVSLAERFNEIDFAQHGASRQFHDIGGESQV